MIPEFSIKINNVPDPLLSADIFGIEVDTNIFLPGMFTILLKDKIIHPLGNLKYTDDVLRFRIGAAVEIGMSGSSPQMIPLKNTIIKGEITGIEPIYMENREVFLRIRGFEKSHRLTMGKNTRTFGNANPYAATVTDQQIVAKIASEAGLIPKVDMSGLGSVRYSYLMQYNQSDWDFLWARAQLLGYQVYVDGNTLNFQKAGATRNFINPSNLDWGEDLRKFEPRLVSMGAVTSVDAIGWDPDKKKEIKASSSSHKSNTAAKINGTATLKSATAIKVGFRSNAEDFVIGTSIRDAGIASVVAKARFAEHDSHFVRASGETHRADPYLVAGSVVKISNVGKRFEGKYYVTEAKHIWSGGEYKIKFKVSGRNPYSIHQVLMGQKPDANKVYGVVIGIVTDLNDATGLGRIKVKFPWMPKYKSADISSNWARLAVIGGGKDRGLYFSPEIDDEVLIAFENGDVNYPYIVGALWNKKDSPPKGKILDGAKKKVNERIVRSRSGHVIILDDTQGKEKITIMDKTEKNSIEIDSAKKSMTFITAGDFTIEAGGKFIVKSKLDILLDTKAKADIKAHSQLNLSGTTAMKLKAGASELDLGAAGATLKGTKIDIQSNTAASIKGSAMVEIQGGIVKIN